MDIWEEGQYKEIWVQLQETEDDERTMMDFLLSNGQLDYYPLSYVLPVAQVTKALTYFEEHRALPKFITWHDDQFL